MSCGMIALVVGNHDVERYVAFENETKYATKTASHNFPMIEQRGDVFDADFTEFEGFDLLCGGSPCTYWSIAQKNNRETEASGMGWELFCQYVRALHEAKPRVFIYENNKSMSAAIRESITQAFGFEPICINSALVSAQNRNRLYWVGKRNEDGTYSKVDVTQPEDRGILLKDILESGEVFYTTVEDKSFALVSSYYKGGNNPFSSFGNETRRQRVAEPVRIPEYGSADKARPLGAKYPNNCGGFEHRMFSENPNKQQVDMVAAPVCASLIEQPFGRKKLEDGSYDRRFEARTDNKSNTLVATHQQQFGMVATPICVAERGRYGVDGIEQHYEAREDGKTNVLTTVQKDNQVCEPVCMRYERSAEAKRIRKQYEAGEVKHGFHELSELHPRSDGKTNTLSTVLKDNPICEPVRVGCLPSPDGTIRNSQAFRLYSTDGKSVNLTAQGGGLGAKTGLYTLEVPIYAEVTEWDENRKPIKAKSYADGKEYPVYEVKDGQITIKGKTYPIKLKDGFYIIRKLTVRECMRLQTVPEWYEFPVSDSQAYKMLGNGWTVDVIVHILSFITGGDGP